MRIASHSNTIFTLEPEPSSYLRLIKLGACVMCAYAPSMVWRSFYRTLVALTLQVAYITALCCTGLVVPSHKVFACTSGGSCRVPAYILARNSPERDVYLRSADARGAMFTCGATITALCCTGCLLFIYEKPLSLHHKSEHYGFFFQFNRAAAQRTGACGIPYGQQHHL
ncbi:MAG: hypothetical protein KBS70_07700 [Bacteroidales bacterium]|nr:hypothetical protein [Candidatus Colicola caccequi]MBQ0154650.1 hypothetical protein [Candidatus Colicola equi]